MILNSIEQGEGAPVILLHGLFGAAKNLGLIARALAKQASVISLDLRNHGDSPHDTEMTYATMAGDVAQTLAAQNITSARLIGHSMGGKTAMTLALTQPNLVEKLVVMDIAPVSYNHSYDDYAAAMLALPLTPQLTRHEADAALAPAIPETAFRSFLLNNLILTPTPHWRIALPEIAAAMPNLIKWSDPDTPPFTKPTLFIRGANSDYIRPSAYPKITQLFPNAEHITIPNAGHWLHAEQPQAVITALETFLR